MRFRDIPQFTRTPCYHVNCEWDYFFEHWIVSQHGFSAPNLNPDLHVMLQKTSGINIAILTSKLNTHFNH